MIDSEINTFVKDLGRPHPSGGIVIERAAIVAQGKHATQIIDWILSHEGKPEAPVTKRSGRNTGGGLHGSRMTNGDSGAAVPPSRFVIPAGALD